MGKRRQQMRKKNKDKKIVKPFVSICTPTFNRRPFFEATIKCYLHQDYPREKLEWIIIDDGTDKIEDLVKDVPGVKYFKYDEKMSLGKKRNLMHEKSKGDIIVYMDDDDYYPKTRVSHAVQTLKNSKALCAGSSEIYIWFKHIQKMYQFGPYGPNHATAGTFAFKRELLKQTSYDENACIAEEKHFLKNYTIPFVQLNPKHSILVFSHEHNTFDKKKLLQNQNPKVVKESDKTVDYFVKEEDLKIFFMETINDLLDDYEPGLPKHKPDVIQQTMEIEKERMERLKNMNQSSVVIKKENGENVTLNNEQVVGLLKQQQNEIQNNKRMIQQLTDELHEKKNTIQTLNEKIKSLEDVKDDNVSIEIIE